MSGNIRYTDEPLGDLKVIPDFLPAPEELAFQEDTVKVTITLSRASVEFFKREAKKHHTQYQKMIRRLLDVYMQTHEKPLTRRSAQGALHAVCTPTPQGRSQAEGEATAREVRGT